MKMKKMKTKRKIMKKVILKIKAKVKKMNLKKWEMKFMNKILILKKLLKNTIELLGHLQGN